MLLAALGIGAFAVYVRTAPGAQRVPEEIRRPKHEVSNPAPVKRHRRGPDVTVGSQGPALRLPVLSGDDVVLGGEAGTPPAGVKPMVYLANATLKELQLDNAKALSVEVEDRNAKVSFNSALDEGFGSSEEGSVVKALQLAMGQFPEIDSFQFVIDGEVRTSLGQLDLSEPIPVIRPDGTKATVTKPSSAQPQP